MHFPVLVRQLKPRLVALLLGLVALVAVTGGGIALGKTLSAQPEPAAAQKAATVSSELSAHFTALSVGAGVEGTGIDSASSEEKSLLERGAAGGIAAQFGLNPSLARQVTYGDSHLWLVPGSEGICIQDYEAGGGSCGSVAQALEGGIAVARNSGEHSTTITTVYGLAPDGNSQVVVHDANGSTEDVPVEHNVYIITHPGAVSAELIDGSGKPQTIELPR